MQRLASILHGTLPRRLGVALLAALLWAAAPAEPAHAIVIDGVAARINSEIITMYDVRQAATPFLLQRGMDPSILNDSRRRSEIYRKVLNDLIERKLLVQEAAKLDLKISEEELTQWLAYTRQQQGLSEAQFKQTIEQYGMSYDDYREMIRQDLLRMRISRIKVGGKVSISDAEVEEVYRRRYGGENGDTEKFITVSHILVQPDGTDAVAKRRALQRAVDARQRVLSGESFNEVAKEVSDGPSAKKGGELGSYRRGELDEEFEAAAFQLEKGEVSEVVETKFGYHVIRVTEVERRDNPDASDRRDQIRGELRQVAMERQLGSYVKGLKSRAYVDIKI